jgi:hypothetical protein
MMRKAGGEEEGLLNHSPESAARPFVKERLTRLGSCLMLGMAGMRQPLLIKSDPLAEKTGRK